MSKEAAEKCLQDVGIVINDVDIIELHDCLCSNTSTSVQILFSQKMQELYFNMCQVYCYGYYSQYSEPYILMLNLLGWILSWIYAT